MILPRLLPLLGIICCLAPLRAQDLHNSQFYLNPVHVSPAATGVFEGKWRFSGIYRAQWQSVPVAYKTYALGADFKAVSRGNGFISFGLLMQNDQAGDARFSWTQGGLNIAAAHTLGKNNLFSLGFGVAGVQRSVDINHLTFKNQWSGDAFDPSLPSREPFERSSGLAASLSAGMAWHYQSTETRSGVTVGAGAFHLNQPEVSLGGIQAARVPLRAAAYGEGIYQIRERADLVGFAAFQRMQKAKEILFGGGVRQILSTGVANFTAVRASLAARWGDAIIPAIQVERNNWLVGLSYDWNTSSFNEATGGRGGIEIAVIYRVVPVPVTKVVKCCPVF